MYTLGIDSAFWNTNEHARGMRDIFFRQGPRTVFCDLADDVMQPVPHLADSPATSSRKHGKFIEQFG